jgi:hypothetical protein
LTPAFRAYPITYQLPTMAFDKIQELLTETLGTDAQVAAMLKQRIQREIREADRFIALEGGRAADLRPVEVQTTLDFYVAHRAKLLALLDA